MSKLLAVDGVKKTRMRVRRVGVLEEASQTPPTTRSRPLGSLSRVPLASRHPATGAYEDAGPGMDFTPLADAGTATGWAIPGTGS